MGWVYSNAGSRRMGGSLHRHLRPAAACRAVTVVASVYLAAAFSTSSWDAALWGMAARASESWSVAGPWLGAGVTQVVMGAADEEPELVKQTWGVGGPGMPSVAGHVLLDGP